MHVLIADDDSVSRRLLQSYLQKWGLIRPVLRTHSDTYYTFADLLVIRQVSAELAGIFQGPAP